MKLYNTLTKTKEIFKPNHDNKVTMYVCGITPYDTTHLGHAFTYMFYDVLLRYLTYKGYTVTYTQNVTDIDDDLLKRAKQLNQNWQELGEFWINKYLTDMKNLNIIEPTYYVKATDTIETMLEIIANLMKKGLAYENEGNIYFSVKKDPDYGKLSRYTREQMIILSKERGADPNDPRKQDPLDFILWQKSLPDEPSWPSRTIAGQSKLPSGRPGWHIECSAMIYKYLYKYIDIHGGGSDLIYPHHESEISQSEAFTGHKPFVKYWLHTGAVIYEGEKMSKSLGNLVMAADLLKKYSANTIRYMLLSHHYREPWEFHESELDEAEKKLSVIAIRLAGEAIPTSSSEIATLPTAPRNDVKNFNAAMDDDLDTPKALEIITKLAHQTKTSPTKENQTTLHQMLQLLGFSF